MHSLLNRTFLLALSCCFLFIVPFNISFIFLLFIAISITCLNYFVELPIFSHSSTLMWGIVACFFPYALCFLPLISYDIFITRSILALIPYVIAIALHLEMFTLSQAIFLFVTMALSFLLYHYSLMYDSLVDQFKKSRDDSIELNSLLQEKNRTLIEKQNAEIYAATLKERNRIAREIHDNVGHLLSRSILMTGALKAVTHKETFNPSIQVLEDTLTTAMDTIRHSVHDLHNRSIDLYEALNALIDNFHYCDISFDYDITSDMPAAIKYTYLTVIKEGLSNIIKHSNATNVTLVLREHPSLYQLILQDNGTVSQTSSTGIGLVSIKERVDALGGNLKINNHSGFRIFITLPKQEEC